MMVWLQREMKGPPIERHEDIGRNSEEIECVWIGHRGIFIGGGVGAVVAGAMLLAFFAGALSDALEGRGQEIFNASILGVAVVMLGWHNLWMASHGRAIARELKSMGQAVSARDKSMLAMAIVVAVAVLREGAEVVLFMYGVAASSNEGWPALLLGGVGGIALGAAVSFLLYRGLVAIPVHRLFSVTNWLIALVAAGMAGQAVAILAGIDLVPSWGDQLWDTRWLLLQDKHSRPRVSRVDGVFRSSHGRASCRLSGRTCRPHHWSANGQRQADAG
jgi:high-affinity iron transporter